MNVSRRSFALFGATAVGGLAVGGNAWAAAPAAVRRVSLESAGATVRLTMALDRPAVPNAFFLASPDRFVVDVANANWMLPRGRISGEGPGAGVVRKYRYAPRPDGACRLVLDLDAPARVVRQEFGQEISFDLAGMQVAAANPPPAPLRVQGNAWRRRTIVLDPGHGAHDPGAIGVTGIREKDVVLDAGLQLRDALEQSGQYRVAMTRDADTFIPLEDRVRFARQQNADLFISIHADSSPNHAATGATVYTLSDHGATRAQNIASAQNWDLDLGNAPRRSVISDILLDLTQRETTNRSTQFAEKVIPNLAQVSPLLSQSPRNAGFFVLLAPDVPAVLVETGFLSNAADEHRLSDPRQRQAIATAMAKAVDDYFVMPRA
ncbi:MAG: N-acetylmuramoyl-L-alanine amidase [Terricaulis sp.]